MKEKCNCIGGCAKPILNEQVMKCQDDVVKREMKERIEQLERLVPKFKEHSKISPLKVDALEWELKALKAESQLAQVKEENAKLKEALKEGKDILSNVYYWETCPEDYKKRIEALTQEKGEE